MPLERYEDGRVFLGSDTCVYFSMVVAGDQEIVACRVSAEALEDYCGADDGDYLNAFESCRSDIERAASAKFDRLIEPPTVLVMSADL